MKNNTNENVKPEETENNVKPEETAEENSGKRDKKYLNPVLGYSVFGGTLVLAVAIALIVLLPLL